jgi:hypothetical protein
MQIHTEPRWPRDGQENWYTVTIRDICIRDDYVRITSDEGNDVLRGKTITFRLSKKSIDSLVILSKFLPEEI